MPFGIINYAALHILRWMQDPVLALTEREGIHTKNHLLHGQVACYVWLSEIAAHMVLENQQQAVDISKWTKRGKPNNMVYYGELGLPVTVVCARLWVILPARPSELSAGLSGITDTVQI